MARSATVCGVAGLVAMCVGICAGAPGQRAMVGRALIVGGGPDRAHNQASIESNVRYVRRLLPRRAALTVLFADGDPASDSVLAESAGTTRTRDEMLLERILDPRGADTPVATSYRRPGTTLLHGPAGIDAITHEFAALREVRPSSAPLLLYFTGHGSMDPGGNLDNNVYDLWGGSGYSVKQLSSEITALPLGQSVVVVMVQCFSGAFGNVLFEGGDPKAPPIERDIAGFFASVSNKPAAGCTPEVNEADYHDFTSYFFAALTGVDRLGGRVTGADFNRDGRVGMDEAFCYTLIHDQSIDVPVCTSDVYLRATSTVPDPEVFDRSFSEALASATPAQAAALLELANQLNLTGEDRAAVAYGRYRTDGPSMAPRVRGPLGRRAAAGRFAAARQEFIAKWPPLADPKGAGYRDAYAQALAFVSAERAAGRYADIEVALRSSEDATKAMWLAEVAASRLTRFVRLFKTVILTSETRKNGDAAVRKRLESLLRAERRTVLPWASPRSPGPAPATSR